jgi:hypothetical protein
MTKQRYLMRLTWCEVATFVQQSLVCNPAQADACAIVRYKLHPAKQYFLSDDIVNPLINKP